MFANDLTLQNAAGDVSKVVSLQSIVDGKSIRGDASAALGSPFILTISHVQVNRGKSATGVPLVADRHLVRLDHTEVDDLGVAQTASVYLVVEAPRAVVTEAMIKQDIEFLTRLVYGTANANVEKLLNNEP